MRFGRHDIRHTPIHGLVHSILSLQHEISVLQAMTESCRNLVTRLRVGQLCSTIQLSPLSGWPQQSTDEVTMRHPLAANFASGVGPYTEIVEHLLHVTAHPQFLALELQAPMGTCSGQYGSNQTHNSQIQMVCVISTSTHCSRVLSSCRPV